MKTNPLPVVLLAFAAMVSVQGRAVAEDTSPGYSIEDVTACSPDAMRLCQDKMPDVDAIEGCMKAHYDELQPKCKARFKR